MMSSGFAQLLQGLLRRCDEFLVHLAETEAMRAIREGLLWLIPFLLAAAAFLMAASLIETLRILPDLPGKLINIHRRLTDLTPLLVAASIGYMLSIRRHLARIPVAFLCLSYASIASAIFGHHSRAAVAFLMPVAIVIPLLAVPALQWLAAHRWLRFNRDGVAGNNVKRALDLIIPGIIVGFAVALAVKSITAAPIFANLLENMRLDTEGSPLHSGIVFTVLNSTLWFFGVHGYHALLPLIDQLDLALVFNQLALANGRPATHIMNSAFLGSFVFIGGSGATLSLALAILLTCRHRQLRLIAMASLPISILNVNEILLFGLPLILNPRLLFPFIVVPVVNVALALTATQAGFVAPATVGTPFNSPIILNAYIATGNDPHAIALQLINILIGIAVYAPFARLVDWQARHMKKIHLASLDTTYTQMLEAAETYGHDPIVQAHAAHNRQATNEVRLTELSDREFFLVYQPQVCRETGGVVGCEALMRCRDRHDRVFGPAEFLPWLEQGKLMRQVDLWCAITACKQYRKWLANGIDIPITINVSADSLDDRQAWGSIIDHLATAHGRVSVEITEHALARNQDAVGDAIRSLHAIEAKIYLDDFGTGYSSLSYLHRFPIDAIKIDRSFVLALENARGRMIMQGLVNFAKALDLRTVVEGVENYRQLALIPSDHPVSIQGWIYSKALEGAQMQEFAEAIRNNFCPLANRA